MPLRLDQRRHTTVHKARAGFMQRCHDHRDSAFTSYDLASLAAAAIALINLLVLLAALRS